MNVSSQFHSTQETKHDSREPASICQIRRPLKGRKKDLMQYSAKVNISIDKCKMQLNDIFRSNVAFFPIVSAFQFGSFYQSNSVSLSFYHYSSKMVSIGKFLVESWGRVTHAVKLDIWSAKAFSVFRLCNFRTRFLVR